MPSKPLKSSLTARCASVSTQPTKYTIAEPLVPLLTAQQTSEYLRVPVSTLAVWRSTGRVHLPFSKAGRAVRYRREDVAAFLASSGTPPAEEVRQVRRPKVLSEAARRLEEFKARHASLQCERCDAVLEEADAHIASHLELPGIEGPRDVHDWHCFCSVCHEALKQPQGSLWTPKAPGLLSGLAAERR